MADLKIVGYIRNAQRRHPNTAKILKILDWPPALMSPLHELP